MFALAAIVMAVSLAPLVGRADIPDGRQCSMLGLGADPVRVTTDQGPSNLDRFAICVTDGTSNNGSELYVGGELQPEQPQSGQCFGVAVLGRTVYGNPNWYSVDRGKDLDPRDDVVHDCQ
jgi:hypothetical protein